MCGDEFSKKEDVDIHLRTCEIYECSSCWLRGSNLSDIKKHIQEKHDSSTKLNHLKMERGNDLEVSSTSNGLKEL